MTIGLYPHWNHVDVMYLLIRKNYMSKAYPCQGNK